MNLLRHALLIVSALALVFPVLDTVSAQQIERPTGCEEVMTVGPVFIGHNCGEFASIMINGRIIIRRPWSRVNRASRAERLRLRAGGVATATTTVPATSPPGQTPPASLNCDDFANQEDAQAYFDSQGWSATNDPFGLDDSGEGDGIACETLPTRNG